MKTIKTIVIVVATAFLMIGCRATIHVSSSISDLAMLQLRINRDVSVRLEVVSNIQDGETIIMNEAGTARTRIVMMNQGTVLRRMVYDYMSAKFSRLYETGELRITVRLNEFTIRDFPTESTGTQVLRALGGTTAGQSRMVSVRQTASIEVVGIDINEFRNFSSTSEEHYTGELSSPVANRTLQRAANEVNNRLLMQMGAFFNEIGI